MIGVGILSAGGKSRAVSRFWRNICFTLFAASIRRLSLRNGSTRLPVPLPEPMSRGPGSVNRPVEAEVPSVYLRWNRNGSIHEGVCHDG